MRKNLIILGLFWFLDSCTQRQAEKSVSVFCLRNKDVIYISINNNSSDTIFVPSKYIGDYNHESDTVFLEAINKEKYSITNYYRYSNIFPFEFYTARLIDNRIPDGIFSVKEQFEFYNQFRLRRFVSIAPGENNYSAISFNVPQSASKVGLVFYKKNFFAWNQWDTVNYNYEQFMKFDSQYSKYSYADIYNYYHPVDTMPKW